MPAHKHAALMALYAQDAMETETPWKRWEFSDTEGVWYACEGPPGWLIDRGYRRKPRTIRIGEFDVPEPVRGAPKIGTRYFYVAIGVLPESACWTTWGNQAIDNRLLQSGLIHLTREDAELHGRALVSLTEVKA